MVGLAATPLALGRQSKSQPLRLRQLCASAGLEISILHELRRFNFSLDRRLKLLYAECA
jgi:hypothetical protein